MPIFLEIDEVLDLHQTSIARHGGDPAVRDIGLLKSAIAQPSAAFGGQFLNPDLPSMAAARVFLLINGARFDPPNKAFEEIVLSIASGQSGKEAATDFFRHHATV